MAFKLAGRCVVVGVSGGIAAYKAAEVVSRLKKEGACVRVVMTENACRFVAPITFETLSGGPVCVSQFDRAYEIEHIALAKQADVMVVAPATANVLGKCAGGIADDLLTTTLMAMPAPILFAPAMNAAMWRSPANQHNVETLRSRGFSFIGPESGQLACGDEDIGRMSEPCAIVQAIVDRLCPKEDLANLRVLVTAGPTREMIDPVRFLSNRSSGKMGYEIARAACRRGARVTLVTGPVSLMPPDGVTVVRITSTRELYERMIELAPLHDAVIQAAAPADFTPEACAQVKIKKTGDDMTLRLVATPDVAKAIGEMKKPGQVLVAFAAETNDLIQNAQAKLHKKNADLIVANDVTQAGAGFGVDTNRVTLISQDGKEALALMPKSEVADVLLDRVLALRKGRL
ncbi:MAG: bifunctional phosphopantothenoylcysteine decarboxylase/phosphopantothenate--cysteine ligase CoaBC [Clostridia bacterium]